LIYDDYIEGLEINVERIVFGLSKSLKVKLHAKDFLPKKSAFTVDRNYYCAALSRYLRDQFGGHHHHDYETKKNRDSNFTSYFHTKALYVDADNHSVIVRKNVRDGDSSTRDMALRYDILLGYDGIRSVVRNAFITNHRDFEFSLKDTFGDSKSAHVNLPKTVEDGTFLFLIEVMPDMGAFILPETGQKLNVAMGRSLNTPVAPELRSEDPTVVANYFAKYFHAFEMDWYDVGKQWVYQSWNMISQVQLN
jgi:hypothetical protein